jgi:hypothetical protein
VSPLVAGVVKPRGSRLMNSRLWTGSTSTSSFSQMYMGKAPSIRGVAGCEMSYEYTPATVETNIVVPMKLMEIADLSSGMLAIGWTLEE